MMKTKKCKCGCGRKTVTGNFMPGHDQKLRARLEQEVGGLLALEKIIISAKRYFAGEISGDDFKRNIRKIFASRK